MFFVIHPDPIMIDPSEAWECHIIIERPKEFPKKGEYPRLKKGQYYITKPEPTRIRCTAYVAPPPNGTMCREYAPGVLLGPVEAYAYSEEFASIRVNDLWINVWCASSEADSWLGINYAYLCGTTYEVDLLQYSTAGLPQDILSSLPDGPGRIRVSYKS